MKNKTKIQEEKKRHLKTKRKILFLSLSLGI